MVTKSRLSAAAWLATCAVVATVATSSSARADEPPPGWLDPPLADAPSAPPVADAPPVPSGPPAGDSSTGETSAPPAPSAPAPAPAPAAAPGDTKAQTVATRAVVHHSPISSAIAGSDLVIDVILDEPHLAKGLTLVRRVGKGPIQETPLARSTAGYRVVVAGADVSPGLAYAIELTTLEGQRVAAFASRGDLHPVLILPDAMDEHEKALLAKLGGRRSSASASGQYVDFGSVTRGDREETDRYWGVEGRYTYRPLRTIAEFGFRGGVIRGTSPGVALAASGEQREVGINYGASSVRLRFHDLWHMEFEGLASISDEGFSTGGGTKLLIGNPYGSKLVLGASFVGLSEETYFGSTFFSRVDLAASDRVTVSPTIEITDMPNAERYGVRLLARVDVALGAGFSAQLEGGYQARRAASGGPGLGGGVTLDF